MKAVLLVLREVTGHFREYFVYPEILIYIAAPEMDIFLLVLEETVKNSEIFPSLDPHSAYIVKYRPGNTGNLYY
jgi:hypothetical protein